MNKDTIRICYLSSGKHPTGGFYYEEFFTKELKKWHSENGLLASSKSKRLWRFFHGWQNIALIYWAFKQARVEVNIVTGRLALSSIFRNIFAKRITLVILHNYDERYFPSNFLKTYFRFFFVFVKLFKVKRLAIVTGAPFWVDYFQTRINHSIPVYFFPNLFDVEFYKTFVIPKAAKRICLGQFSNKNDPAIFTLAAMLTQQGYECYFATLNPSETSQMENFNVICEPSNLYLKRLSSCLYSVAFTQINEGWNRMAHESILLNTPVIGFAKAGLGDLISESNSYAVTNVDEAFEIIISNKTKQLNQEFALHYDKSKASHFIDPIGKYVKNQLGK